MNRIGRIGMVLALSCFLTGCFTAISHMSFGDGGASSSPQTTPGETLLCLSLDILTSPIQVPLLIDYWISKNCVPLFYRHNRWDKNRKRCRERLKTDFCQALQNERYLKKYDTDGWPTEEHAALLAYLEYSDLYRRLTPEQAQAVAKTSLAHPELFSIFAPLWKSRHIGAEPRMQALTVLRGRGEIPRDSLDALLDSSQLSTTNLQQIVDGEVADSAARQALDLLDRRSNEECKREVAQKMRPQICVVRSLTRPGGIF